jgi:sulfate adenylyltransferase subunit 2
MDQLERLENKSIYIIREAYVRFQRLALLWSIGKDSTTVLWLCRKAFFGKVPFPVVHIDTTFKFPQMYAFRDRLAREWRFNLITETNWEAIHAGIDYQNHDAFTCCHELKTVALQKAIEKHRFDALLVGIRRDEHGIRAKERVFSGRDIDFRWNYELQPAEVWDHYQGQMDDSRHTRIHPLLGWTEKDVWRYTRREGIPVNELYLAKDGKRYRSLGCMPITNPVDSSADTIDKIIEELETTTTAERSGRSQDKEQAFTMQKLRSLGYM